MKTSVSLMLGSVVNTLEQRGEWLNGGRGAAKGMIDRLSANQVTPFGAAEHSEFWSRWCSGVCANGFLQGEMGGSLQEGKDCKSEGTLPSYKCVQLLCVRERRTANMHMHRYAGPGGGQHAPVESHAFSLARLKTQSSHLQWPAREKPHHKFTSCLSPIWRPLLSDTFFFFCLPVGFPKFVSGKSLASSTPDACRGPTKPI